jgi:hypothetical protein
LESRAAPHNGRVLSGELLEFDLVAHDRQILGRSAIPVD